jgi:OOP family OmpA-OmpF porin
LNKYAVASFSVLALTATTAAMAAQDPTMVKSVGLKSGWYIGLGISRTQTGIPSKTVDNLSSGLAGTTSPPADFVEVDKKKQSTGLKTFVGYSFNRNFALEAGYAYLGKSNANMDGRVTTGGVSNAVSNFGLIYKMSSVFLDGVGTLPIGDKWSLFGRVGLGYNRVTTDGNGSNGGSMPLTLGGSSDDRVSHKVNVKFGAGAGYDFTSTFGVRAEWERYRMKDPIGDETFWTDAATLSAVMRF